MRICSVSDLQPGMELGKSLFDEKGRLLLRAGFALDSEVLKRLVSTGRSAVYIHEDGTDDIIPEEVVSEETCSRAVQAFSYTMDRVVEAVSLRPDVPPDKLHMVVKRGAEYRNVVNVEQVSGEITSIVDEILDSSAQVLNQLLIKSRVGYNTEHALDTALIALMAGRRLMYSRRDLLELGTGAFLHDLGKLALSELLEKSPADYTEADRAALREHPLLGKLLLANSTDRLFMAQTAILHHHERQDGLGYPGGLQGRNSKPYLNGHDARQYIFPFAEIIAAADAYDNLISGRSGVPLSPEQALRELARESKTVFNSEVVALLAQVICIFPTGSMVRIVECSSHLLIGTQGVVMKPNDDKPHQPILVLMRDANGRKITPKTLDLSAEQSALLELIL
ncbi:HD domain-containing protein [bacterium]|nr:HD domain-containing protein [bacterium]MBU1983622.1 HD domain-containing protein [bacterium]